MFSSISVGRYRWTFEGPTYTHPSEGWIWTNGTNGIKEWNGTLRGKIREFTIEQMYMGDVYQIGASGFCGIKITRSGNPGFFGFARKVKIDYW
jgi:hypothetical protein